ncbi:hypothetical protein [Prescottella subtropica]|uniref:hypothetical protein n=1 Tax=Prescottella subtropica TaxID=2545757 RepID=UPI0010F86B96|nr:hypothetical protein [Prescottella subtropica]
MNRASSRAVPQWASAFNRRSIATRWGTALLAGPVGLYFVISGTYFGVGLIIAGATPVIWSMIHHRELSRLLPWDRDPVVVDRTETVIRTSVTITLVMLGIAAVFGGTGWFIVQQLLARQPVMFGEMEMNRFLAILVGPGSVAMAVGVALAIPIGIARDPIRRAGGFRLSTTGMTTYFGWRHASITWDAIEEIAPVPEQTVSAGPSYSIDIVYRVDRGARRRQRKRFQLVGPLIPVAPEVMLAALRDYAFDPELRAELGTPASITRLTTPTPPPVPDSPPEQVPWMTTLPRQTKTNDKEHR